MQFEAVVKPVYIRQENLRLLNARGVDMMQILSLLQEAFQVVLKGMRTEQVQKVLYATIGMVLYCQKDERVPHTFHHGFEDNKLLV